MCELSWPGCTPEPETSHAPEPGRTPGPAPGYRRGHPARSGTLPYNRGRLTRTGTGFLSPAASNVPARSGPHPAAWNVPGRTAQGGAWWRMRYSGEGVLSLGLVVVRECIGIQWPVEGPNRPHGEPDVQIGDKGLGQSETDEMKPHDSAVLLKE